MALCLPVRAQEPAPLPAAAQPLGSALRLERDDDGVYLSTTLELVLPPLVKEALYQGIAIYFVTEAEVARERWYWSDKKNYPDSALFAPELPAADAPLAAECIAYAV